MSIYIVHISDFHIETISLSIAKKFECLNRVLEALPHNAKILLLATGDISFSGKTEELKDAERLFLKIDKLRHGSDNCKVIFCPGNHDFDFENSFVMARDNLISVSTSGVYSKGVDAGSLKILTDGFNAFSEFCSKFNQKFDQKSLTNIYDISEFNLRINLLNSAWLSKKRDEKNKFFPESVLAQLEHKSNAINITIYHHPDSWFVESEKSNFKKAIRMCSDFVFTGHEHSDDLYRKSSAYGDEQYYFEAGVFFDKKQENQSAFRIIEICDQDTFRANEYSWSGSHYEGKMLPVVKIPKNSLTNSNGLSLKRDFARYLDDPGASLVKMQSSTKSLKLTDFFVFPTLFHASNSEVKDPEFVLSMEDFFEVFLEKKLLMVSGDDYSGKTSLAKRVFSNLFSRGLSPLLVDGDEAKGSSLENVRSTLKKAVSNQYADISLDFYIQNSDSGRILLIDNFESISSKSVVQSKFIEQSLNFFKRVIIFCDDSVVSNAKSASLSMGAFQGFYRFEICQMNSLQRTKLIENWLYLGSSDEEKAEFDQSKIEKAKNLLDTFVLSNIPKYPLFVLTFLEHIEAHKNFDIRMSSNAKMIETLINLNFLAQDGRKISTQTKEAFLCDLAFMMFKDDKRYLSQEEFEEFNRDFCEKSDLSVQSSELLSELEKTKIIYSNYNGISFKYSYFRHYYIAKYLSYNISDERIRREIERMSDNLYLNENANIFSILSLYTKDRLIVDLVFQRLKSCMDGKPVGDIKGLCEALTQNLRLDIGDLKTDEIEAYGGQHSNNARRDDYKAETNDSDDTVSYGIKLIYIVGQIVRNLAESLDGSQKRDIIVSVYTLVLKIVGLIEDDLNQDGHPMAKLIADAIHKEKPELSGKDFKDEFSQKMLESTFYALTALHTIVARALGDEILKLSFKKSLEQNQEGFQTFDIAIKMYCFKEFPTFELMRSFDAFRDHKLAQIVLRSLTLRTIKFSKMEPQEIDRIASKLSIPQARLLAKRGA